MQKDSMLQLEDFGRITNQLKFEKGRDCLLKDVSCDFNYKEIAPVR